MDASFAILADSHVPGCRGTAQEAALGWALGVCATRGVKVVVGLGDLTAAGDRFSADRVLGLFRACPLPSVQTPGNAELRTSRDAGVVRRVFSEPCFFRGADWGIVALDTAEGSITEAEKAGFTRRLAALGSLRTVVVTHWPPQAIRGSDRLWLADLCRVGNIELIVAGHKHMDAVGMLAGVPVHVVRGLDPDKAKHGAPAVSLFRRSRDEWVRCELPFEMSDPATWGAAEKRELAMHLGVSTMSHTIAYFEEAIEAGIRNVELRFDSSLQPQADILADLVSLWRSGGGRILSVHCPNLRWDADAGAIAGQDEFAASIRFAGALHADHVTVHVPRVSVACMTPGGEAWSAFIEVYGRLLRDVASVGTTVGIENLHTQRSEPSDGRRRFGCLPSECLSWIDALRSVLAEARIGFHLDIGHARNNPPFSTTWTLGRWYAETGAEVVAYHVHQVNGNGNHQPMHRPFGPLISLASFFWAWRTGQVTHGPIFLEIRGEPGRVSWEYLRRHILGGGDPVRGCTDTG